MATDSKYSEIVPLDPSEAGSGVGVTWLDMGSEMKHSASSSKECMVTSNSIFTLEYQYEDLKDS